MASVVVNRAALFAAGALAGAAAFRLLSHQASRQAKSLIPWRKRFSSPSLALGFHQQVTFIFVNDLSSSADFYENLLGLRPVLDQVPPGEQRPKVRIFETTATSYVGLCEKDPSSLQGTDVARDSVILCLVTDEVDEWAESLRRQGVQLEKPPTLNPRYNIYHLFIRDPDGHLVEIQQFRDPVWPRLQISGDSSDGLLTVLKSSDWKKSDRAANVDCESWPLWTCPALPDPAGCFEESRWWEKRPGAAEERCLIVEGRAVLTTAKGEKFVIETDDWVTFRRGFLCTWEVTDDISKKYAYYKDDGSLWVAE